MRSRNVIVPVPAFSIVYVIRWVSSPVDLATVKRTFIIARYELCRLRQLQENNSQTKHPKYGNFLRSSRPAENQKETIPESIAAQWIPGRFFIIFWKRAALIFYRDIDCQSIVSVSGLSILWSSELAAFRESFTCPSVSGWISFSLPPAILHIPPGYCEIYVLTNPELR